MRLLELTDVILKLHAESGPEAIAVASRYMPNTVVVGSPMDSDGDIVDCSRKFWTINLDNGKIEAHNSEKED
tara:strand:- start:227 stop:442 length:216 start_codon:yes stop_codon:yes gene_type:complete